MSAARGHEIQSHVVGCVLRMGRARSQVQLFRHISGQIIRGATLVIDMNVPQAFRHAVIAGRQQGQYRVHDTDIGTDTHRQNVGDGMVVQPIQQGVRAVGLEAAGRYRSITMG